MLRQERAPSLEAESVKRAAHRYRPTGCAKEYSSSSQQQPEVNRMQLVEQHVISKHDPRYGVIDEAAFKSKNLYNAALYEVRQAFIHEGKYLNYSEMDKRMQSSDSYKALPAKVSQQVLVLLDKNWIAFFEARAAYEEDPSKFTGRPHLPKYKHKQEGRNILVYTVQALSQPAMRDGLIRPSGLPITIETENTVVEQVRIINSK